MNEIVGLAIKKRILQRNEFLTEYGKRDDNVYFVESGSLRVFVLNEQEEQSIRFGYPGNLIVALDSFLTQKPTQLYIQALKKTVIKVIEKQQLEAFLNTENNKQLWLGILENLVLQQMEREIDLLTHNPKERYLRVLHRSPQLFQEIPHKHIANYLRMSPETLSRLKKS